MPDDDIITSDNRTINAVHKFNITLRELEAAYEYAKEHGKLPCKTVCMARDGGPIGGSLFVSSDWKEGFKDITDYDCL